MIDKSIWLLAEREKELECIYAIDAILQDKQLPLPAAMKKIVQVLPSGFSDPSACRIRIELYGVTFDSPKFNRASFLCSTPIVLDDQSVGVLQARYLVHAGTEPAPLLPTEAKIMAAAASRISQIALGAQQEINMSLHMLEKVNPSIFAAVYQKLLYYVSGLKEHMLPSASGLYGEVNTPLPKCAFPDELALAQKLVSKAAAFLPSSQIRAHITAWIQEEHLASLIKVIGRSDCEVGEILDAIVSYKKQATQRDIYSPTEKWIVAQLAHRFLTTDEQLIDRVLYNLSIEDFEPLLSHLIGSPHSSGGIGGKGAGLFIAQQIIRRAAATDPLLQNITIPRTWYLAADQMDEFLRYNHMEELHTYKYNPISYIRMTYSDIVTRIKNARLTPQIMRSLAALLDDFDHSPIIVRSSSLLEDRSQSAFSGKYKSLYLANQGSKQERLSALTDAILEVYSSQYNPDSFQYREQRHLLHFCEKMGILIQEVVGTRVGPYYMPLFAGVAFSENPFCWSPRISREGGLVRMVMGLGTRAVDRVNNDYPVLFSPESPGFKINQNPEDILHYSPRYIDLMNLEKGSFETLEIGPFLREWGNKIPQLHRMASVYNAEMIQKKGFMDISPKKDELVITFDGVLSDTDFPKQITHMFDVLKEKMGIAIDLEFAHDGEHLVLLQCRSLNSGLRSEAAPIPQNIPKRDILFTANRFVLNGRLKNIRHIVYVDPDAYSKLTSREDLLAVGQAVGVLNRQLPLKQYILMGPGRWGSRGDIQLGVRVTYSDICNTALLIEIAKKKQAYVPEVSFGTHFFQDLVESDIGYLPLYPGQDDTHFNERFLLSQPNHLEELLPQYAALADVIRVIDLSTCPGKKTLSVHMNAALGQAVAFLNSPVSKDAAHAPQASADAPIWRESGSDQHWRWRKYMAEQIAEEMDFSLFGVKGLYLFGSTDEETAGMGSDIDLLVHFGGDEAQRSALSLWLDGWSQSLCKINYLRTGFSGRHGLLDVHIVTDEDIARSDSFALRIHSVLSPATPLRVEE